MSTVIRAHQYQDSVYSPRVILQSPESKVCPENLSTSDLGLSHGLWSSWFILFVSSSINENKNPKMNCHGTLGYELYVSVSEPCVCVSWFN